MGTRIDYAKASPEGFKAFGGAYVYLRKSGLSEELIYLVYLRVSQINGCAYCIDMHSRDLPKLGITVDKLALVPVWRAAGVVFSIRERIALGWSETVTRVAETGVPDADYEAAGRQITRRPHICDRPDERLQSIRNCVPLDPRCCRQSLSSPPGRPVSKLSFAH